MPTPYPARKRLFFRLLVIAGAGVFLLLLYRFQENTVMPQSSHVAEELKRARALLSPRRVKTTLSEIAPDPAPESIGAQAGIGFKAPDADIQFSVYVFEDWEGSSTAARNFTAQHEGDPNVYAASAMNGTLVLYGLVQTNTPDGIDKQFQLADFVSAFAGDERDG